MADLPLWRREALGIPPWPGAHFYDRDSVFTRICDDVEHGMVLFCDGACAPVSRCTVALDQADTRAAFVRRLALRLGCPEQEVDECVGFCVYTDGGWLAVAGIADEDGVYPWMHGEWAQTGDRLLALVRAWRSVEVQGG